MGHRIDDLGFADRFLAVVVPQSMSYAILASLTAEYGLYSSFIGVFLYCFFATSKDVTIGVSHLIFSAIDPVLTFVDSIARRRHVS